MLLIADSFLGTVDLIYSTCFRIFSTAARLAETLEISA